MGQLHSRGKKSSVLELFAAISGSRDEYMPANGVTVRLKNSDEEIVGIYETDQNYNGIFVFYDLAPGNYYIELKGEGFRTRQGKVNITQVKAKATTYKSIYMISGTSTPFDDETAVEAIPGSQGTSQAVYDLSGRRVTSPRKGIYIQGGKKIVW